MDQPREKQPWKKPHRHNTNRGLTFHQNVEWVEPDESGWRERAACRGMDVNIFFPIKGQRGTSQASAAKKICAKCPVSEPCLAYGMAMGDRTGIWGGLTSLQRRRLRNITQQ